MTCTPDFNIGYLNPSNPDFKKFLEMGGVVAEGVETAFGKYSDLLKQGLIQPGKEKDAAVKAFADSYAWLADRANTWLNQLPANGPIAEAYKNSVAQGYVEQALKLQNDAISTDAKLAQLTADVNSRVNAVSAGGLSNYVGRAFDAAQIATAFADGDTAGVYSNLAQMIGAELGGIAAGAIAAGAITGLAALGVVVASPALVVALAAGAGAAGAAYFGKSVYDDIGKFIAPYAETFGRSVGNLAGDAADFLCGQLNDLFNSGQRWTAPRDPLVLDLDGDGVELTSSSSSVLFDHNADNIRTGSQWVMPDDGLLVRDVNGNGLIDSGRELFGDQTQIGTGTNIFGQAAPLIARNGFEALRALDSNGDALINSGDAAFSELRVWQDTNQDGISQSTELRTLAELGISQIKLGSVVPTGQINMVSGTPQTVYRDERGETTGQSSFTVNGQEQTVRNINFQTNPFYRDFTDSIAITEQANSLPDMQGSGLVRDLRQAMSQTDAHGNLSASASSLQSQVQGFATAQSAQERQGVLGGLIAAWGNTSSLRPALQRPWLNNTELLGGTSLAANLIAFHADPMRARCSKRLKSLRKNFQKLKLDKVHEANRALARMKPAQSAVKNIVMLPTRTY